MTDTEKMEVTNGGRRAVFVKDERGWTPDWFYEGDRQMLRFKDHQWLSIGQVHPDHAANAERLPDGGARFSCKSTYGITEVKWSVTVRPDPEDTGLIAECVIEPAANIELLEAYSTFETPYDYDGTETAITTIGMNPTVKWEGSRLVTPETWKNPAWAYSRVQSVRALAPSHAPFLCQALEPVNGDQARYITVAADWSFGRVRDICVHPTRNTPNDPPSAFYKPAETRGYKYLLGAVNWSSATVKDPNVQFERDRPNRQRLAINFSTELPGGTMDSFYQQGWERVRAFDIPADGRVAAYDAVTSRGVTWRSAMDWMRDMFSGDGTEEYFLPEKGLGCYTPGTRPVAGGHGWYHWGMYGPRLRYRAEVTAEKGFERHCDVCDKSYAEYDRKNPAVHICSDQMPSAWWAYHHKGEGDLADTMKAHAGRSLEFSIGENKTGRTGGYDTQAHRAEAYFLTGLTHGKDEFIDQGLLLLEELHQVLDKDFWGFNSAMGYGRAGRACILAGQTTGDPRHMQYARRYARYGLARCYATHNDSPDPDFDYRGWCNGTLTGRDLISECPPWETSVGLLCFVSLMEHMDLDPGFYDVVWYFARTGLAQFPAARTIKRVYDQSGKVSYVPRDSIESERAFYDVFPYLAYENPHDQTLSATYQGADCLTGELVFGDGLAAADDDRLCVIVPRAATFEPAEITERKMVVWNPLAEPVETTISAKWPDGTISKETVTAPSRKVVHMTLCKD
ncbi:MAG: hypothetical protein HQ559_12920 [Lentisphaerae bacterium]|nr:hypothetical protein [Lentisphaerota bacterium]